MTINKKLLLFVVSLSFLFFTQITFAIIFLKLPYPLQQSLTITQGYGSEELCNLKKSTHCHKDLYALDFSGKISEVYDKPVIAVSDGEIYKINSSNKYGGGYGYYIQIIHEDNSLSMYAHLNNVNQGLSIDQIIKQGELIGTIGNTGKVSPLPTSENPYGGTHLHFAMYQKQGDGSLVAYKPEPISGYANLMAGMVLKSDNVFAQKEQPPGFFSFVASSFSAIFDLFNPPKPEQPFLVTTPETNFAPEPETEIMNPLVPSQAPTATTVVESGSNNPINPAPELPRQPVPQVPQSPPTPAVAISVSMSPNFSIPFPGFGGGAPPPPAEPAPESNSATSSEPEPAPEPESEPPADTTPPDISFSISECENSLALGGCLLATTTLNFLWSSLADDLDYYEITLNDYSTSTTTATSTEIIVSDNSINTFSVRAKDIVGNWSLPQSLTAEISLMPVVINEVAWMGTPASGADEWIELYNRTDRAIAFNENWVLYSQTDIKPYINLSGSIPAKGYYLIERTSDDTIKDTPADLIASFGSGDGMGLSGNTSSNNGEILVLTYASTTIDKNILCNGYWCGGSLAYRSMERIDTDIAGTSANNWAINNDVIRNGRDADNNQISATPKARNSVNYLIANGQSYITSDIVLIKEKSPYLVNNTIQVFYSNAALIIEPGVVIKFYNDAGMIFADNAKILAHGTAEEPIVFTAFADDEYGGDLNEDLYAPAGGLWFGIKIDSSSNDSVFDHVIMRYGGKYYTGTDMNRANLRVINSSVNITNSVFEHSKIYGLVLGNVNGLVANNIFRNNNEEIDPGGVGSGLYVSGGSPFIQANNISQNNRGLYVYSSGAVVDSNVFESNRSEAVYSVEVPPAFTNNSGFSNGRDIIMLYGGSSGISLPNSTTTIKYNPIPYVLSGAVSVRENSVLVVEKDVVIQEGRLDVWGTLMVHKDAKIESVVRIMEGGRQEIFE